MGRGVEREVDRGVERGVEVEVEGRGVEGGWRWRGGLSAPKLIAPVNSRNSCTRPMALTSPQS